MLGRNKPTITPRLRPYKAEARSSITNGKLFGTEVDGRSRAARRWRDVFQDYFRQTDGRHEVLCRSLASLVVERERLDAAIVRGEAADPLHLVRVCGAIARTLERLNVACDEPEALRKRRAREDREAGLVA
jgi:hypothetical protein